MGGCIHYDLICSNMTTEHRDFFFRAEKGVHFEFLCTHKAEGQKGKYNFTEKVK